MSLGLSGSVQRQCMRHALSRSGKIWTVVHSGTAHTLLNVIRTIIQDRERISGGGHISSKPDHTYGAIKCDITCNADLAVVVQAAETKKEFTACWSKAPAQTQGPRLRRHRAGIVEGNRDGGRARARRLLHRAGIRKILVRTGSVGVVVCKAQGLVTLNVPDPARQVHH